MPTHKPVLANLAPPPQETEIFNQKMIETIEAGSEVWDLDCNVVRQARREGKGIFPLEPTDPDAETFPVSMGRTPVELRAIRPDNREARGVFLHIHGGGWVYGNADMQDQRLKEIANGTGLTCLSVEYRLVPENPYPAPLDDCETAALWLATSGQDKFNTSFLAIGGESAGAHLAANALLRLRDRHNITPYHSAILIAGFYDLGLTPSAANFKSSLILRNFDLVKFTECLLQNNEDQRDPDVSPLYADLHDMPPTHFSIGTGDPLLDDTLFMANCWARSQEDVELDIYPGACHVFQYFEQLQQARESRANILEFLNRQIEKHINP